MTTRPPPHQIDTRAGYDRWAAGYDDDDNPLIVLEERHLGDVLGDVRGLEVLDLGCGTGRRAIRMARAGARVTGVDYSGGMLQRARDKAQGLPVQLIEHDVTRPLPFEANAFDAVLCCLVLEHLQDIAPVMAEMGRVLRRGGIAVISELHPELFRKGVQARFTDPETGVKMQMTSAYHPVSEHEAAAGRAGLHVDHVSEHVMDAETAAPSEGASKYVGEPMLLLLRLRKT